MKGKLERVKKEPNDMKEIQSCRDCPAWGQRERESEREKERARERESERERERERVADKLPPIVLLQEIETKGDSIWIYPGASSHSKVRHSFLVRLCPDPD